MDKYEALTYCGIYCGSCQNYKKNMNCAGCRNEAVLVDDCETKVCAVKRGLLHCGLCTDFPCGMMEDFYSFDKPSRQVARQGMERIRQIGADAWLAEQKAEQGHSPK